MSRKWHQSKGNTGQDGTRNFSRVLIIFSMSLEVALGSSISVSKTWPHPPQALHSRQAIDCKRARSSHLKRLRSRKIVHGLSFWPADAKRANEPSQVSP